MRGSFDCVAHDGAVSNFAQDDVGCGVGIVKSKGEGKGKSNGKSNGNGGWGMGWMTRFGDIGAAGGVTSKLDEKEWFVAVAV
jgi:hypothetical protein